MGYIKSAFVVILQYTYITNAQILDRSGVTAETATSILPYIAGLQWYFCCEIIMTNNTKGGLCRRVMTPWLTSDIACKRFR
jgi:hypothetical protein